MAEKKDDFPNLRDGEWKQSSDPDPKYNCIAYAAGRTDVYWWPDSFPDPDSDYWPAGVRREETVVAFVELYESLGYEVCSDGSREEGYEKVALFAAGEEPTHAAKQLSEGGWVSKLGPQEDIQHDTLDALAGPCYGQVVRFLRRRVTQ